VITVTTLTQAAPTGALADEHSVLLWQTCAYAEDLSDAAQAGQRLTPAYDAMLEFLHYRLLPYLRDEERQFPPSKLRDEQMTRLVLADHERLRADVDNVESSRTRRLLTIASDVLVDRLDHHARREERWVAAPTVVVPDGVHLEKWAVPLLLTDDIDLDSLPAEHVSGLVIRRLQRMHAGDTVRLHAGHDLHALWRQQHAGSPDTHVWVYEAEGPADWIARITRRAHGTT
jgi:uncharacterized protein (DUF2249 family)